MDYELIHGPGISSFSSSPHRMPTVSAAQALKDLAASPTKCISTSLGKLDHALQNQNAIYSSEGTFAGGVSRGNVTEIYGPPGVGKTTLAMQLASNALHANDGVVWVDASHPLPGPRFLEILKATQTNTNHSRPLNVLDNLTQFTTPSLAHLIALIAHPSPQFPPPKTSLIIIDSLSTLIASAFPRTPAPPSITKNLQAPNPYARKLPILQYLITSFQKLAATRNIAVVIFSQCITKLRFGAGAVLVPAISATAWEQGLGCRVALYRDWADHNDDELTVHNIHVAHVLKAEGIQASEGETKRVAFSISKTGIVPPLLPVTLSTLDAVRTPIALQSSALSSKPHPLKRKLAATDFEVPDSEGEDDEDYGWAEEDEEEMPAMPPQWQGSEDILIPPPREMRAEDENENEDEDKQGNNRVIEDSEDELP